MERSAAPAGAGTDPLAALIERRRGADAEFLQPRAAALARCCHELASRFAAGGRLLAVGSTPAACSDAHHVAVEFVHPVIVGKRALPAIAVTGEPAALTAQADALLKRQDVLMSFGGDPGAEGALELAAGRGCLTVSFGELAADHRLAPDSADPLVRQELVETAYHVLWELCHVFFDHRGLLAGRTGERRHDAGGSSFLYPFLAEAEDDLEGVLGDVADSAVAKAGEADELRERTLAENRSELIAAARTIRASREGGGRVLAFGNGGSATDAMDLVADLTAPPAGAAWPRGAAIDLSGDAAVLTAIANDIGAAELFQRQLIAHGRPGDVVVGLSTSGGSENVLAAFAQARRAGIASVAFVGYDGGRVASERLADHVIVTRSEHIPRIQEAQASAYHSLLELTADGS